jgi:hypothetical protein
VNRLLLGPITSAGHEQDLAITISYADTDTGAVIEADTIFNSAYDWTSITSPTASGDDGRACGSRYDLQNVATHEAGHFFGLGEDYQDQATTMYVSSMPCQTTKRTLSTVDVSVISGLYSQPIPNPPQNAAGCGGARIAGGRGSDGAAPIAMGVVAFVLLRRNGARKGGPSPSTRRPSARRTDPPSPRTKR